MEGCTVHRHSKDHDTPFAVYTGMHMFAKTRKRQLVDMLHENGLSISYTRVLEILAQLGEAVVAQYVEDGVVCPPVLRKKLFTTSAVDNNDHNPTATTAKTSFHGTSISIFQHPSSEQLGEEREPIKLNADAKVKKVPELPRCLYKCLTCFHHQESKSSNCGKPAISQHLSRFGVISRRSMPGWKRCLSHRVWTMRSVSHGYPIMQHRRGASHLK